MRLYATLAGKKAIRAYILTDFVRLKKLGEMCTDAHVAQEHRNPYDTF